MGLRTPSPKLILLIDFRHNQINWFQTTSLTDLQKGKKETTLCKEWLLRGVLQKYIPKNLGYQD